MRKWDPVQKKYIETGDPALAGLNRQAAQIANPNKSAREMESIRQGIANVDKQVASGQRLAAYKDISSLKGSETLQPQQVQASPWYDMAAQKYQDAQAQTLAAIPQQQNSAAQQAQNMLAMRGGLGAGVGARLGGKAEEAAALARQGVLGQGESDMASLGMQRADANTELGKANAQTNLAANQFNVGNQIANQSGLNEYNKYKYGQEMKVLGSERSAYALQNAGQGGKK